MCIDNVSFYIVIIQTSLFSTTILGYSVRASACSNSEDNK